jgi:hypothetical protein
MTRVAPHLLLQAAARNAAAFPIRPHQKLVATVAAFPELLSPGERWLLDTWARLPSLSERQQARLMDMAVKVERGRK